MRVGAVGPEQVRVAPKCASMLPFPAEIVVTDASWDGNKTAADDATDRSLSWAKLQEVVLTSAS